MLFDTQNNPQLIHNPDNLPQVITELFTLNKQVHDYNTSTRIWTEQMAALIYYIWRLYHLT